MIDADAEAALEKNENAQRKVESEDKERQKATLMCVDIYQRI